MGAAAASVIIDYALSVAASLFPPPPGENATRLDPAGTTVQLQEGARGRDAVRACEDWLPYVSAVVETDRSDFSRQVLTVKPNGRFSRLHRFAYQEAGPEAINGTMRFALAKAGWDTMGLCDRLASATKYQTPNPKPSQKVPDPQP